MTSGALFSLEVFFIKHTHTPTHMPVLALCHSLRMQADDFQLSLSCFQLVTVQLFPLTLNLNTSKIYLRDPLRLSLH